MRQWSTTSKRGSDTVGIQRNSTRLDFIWLWYRQRPQNSGWFPPTSTSADSLHKWSKHHPTSCNDVKLSRSLKWRSGQPHTWDKNNVTHATHIQGKLHFRSVEHEKKSTIRQPPGSTKQWNTIPTHWTSPQKQYDKSIYQFATSKYWSHSTLARTTSTHCAVQDTLPIWKYPITGRILLQSKRHPIR